MTDLYARLGLTREASPASIKRAFRQLARKHHPDLGGSAQEFAAIKRAHDVLIDPVKRAHYDATGLLGDEPPDPARAQMLDILSYGLDRALFALAQEMGAESSQTAARLPQLAIRALQERRAEWVALREGYEAAFLQAQMLQGRLLLPHQDSAIEDVLLRRLDICQRQSESLIKQIDSLDQAIDLLAKSVLAYHTELPNPAAAQTIIQNHPVAPAPPKGASPQIKPEHFPYLDDGESVRFR